MTDLKEILVYKYDFGSLYYEPESRGAEATVRLVATGDYNQSPIEQAISFYSSVLQDFPVRVVRDENRELLKQLGDFRIATVWVRYFEFGSIDFQVAIIPTNGKQRFYIRSSADLSEDQQSGIIAQIKRAFRP